ncbi:protein kinase domain-containing protein [Microcoleus vaginatus]|uniref:protein kinase domain-containing protein n=1 Tax=Microcoleus vaginatus TaxID=119532 RepID=UPI001682EE18|nr:protein kinase [Microcoleus sp. FACHB-84]MBD2010052.1 protein kinase [Microcoleus sp. FACHB-45]
MSSKVTLTITSGNLKGREFTFDTRTTCIIGRAKDCYPKIPDDEKHRTISRYHCLLDINPPDIRVRDFGSKNGTFVNGKKIGQREAHQTPEEAAQIQFPEYDLQKGDEFTLSDTSFRVGVALDPEIVKNLQHQTPPVIPSNQANLWEMLQAFLLKAVANESHIGVLGDYLLLKELGRGGFSLVYLARHKRTNEQVALKVMLPKVAANQRAVNWFLREVENMKVLKHPNVVGLKEFGYADETFFFTMEYCDGGSVVDLMEKRGFSILPIGEAVAIILQVLDGLTYTHNAEIPNVRLADGSFAKGRGLIHRDLKPGNIFLANVGGKQVAKIGDYGLAKAFDQAGLSGQTMTGNVVGTPYFMPRQQVVDYKYAQPDVDVWAAAACLYVMITGYSPRNLQGQDPFLAVLQNDAVPVRDRTSAIPQPLATVIDRALIDNPDIYYKSAAEFKQALLNSIS